ncbi:MAG: EamA family transporter [Clostridia bacterium]|nr:EamA family transporter [Clostridia bacterium]
MNYLLLFLTALFIVFQKVIQDRYNAKCRSGVFLFSGMISFFAMCFFMAVNRDWTWSSELIIPAVSFGLSYAAATVFVVLAIRCGSLAKTTLITSYSLLVPAFAGLIILREPLGLPMIAGMILLVLSLWLTNHRKKTADAPKEKISLKWLVFVLLGFVGNGMCSTVQKLAPHYLGADVNLTLSTIAALGLSTVVLIAASFLTRETDLKSTLRVGGPLSLFCGLFNGAVNYLAIYLNQFIPASVMFPVLSAGELILIVPYSLLVRRERFTAKQWAGFAVGVVSVVLLNL